MADNKIPSRYNWIFSKKYKSGEMFIDDKDALIRKYFADALKKILTMFKYEKIPETISPRTIELFILSGSARVFRKDDKWYVANGNQYGVNNFDYLPPDAILTNVGLNFFKSRKIAYEWNKEDVKKDIEKYVFVVPNDELFWGLFDEIQTYAEMQTECLLTLKFILYNNRIPVVANVMSDETKTSFENFYSDIVDGKTFNAISGTKLLDSIKSFDVAQFNQHTTNQLKDVIECMQYLKASFENNIGLNANYNMKRESLNDDEIALNDDNLLPSIDEMLKCRTKIFDLINECSGEEIFKIDLDSAWKNRRKEIDIEFKQQEQETNNQSNDNKEGENNDDQNQTSDE